nr:PREDICTED: protein Simiate isoform X2 [Musa acuminata subsp. malaccensis]
MEGGGEEGEPLQSDALEKMDNIVEDEELRSLLIPDVKDLPSIPPSAVESNFARYYAAVGLAPSHVALREEGGVTAVNFNVGKSDRSEMKVTGKRKRNAQHFDAKTSLCKVCANGKEFIVRCCVKGSLLEVNDRLLKQPDLLNSSADREGYIAIIMPKPIDWPKIKDSLLSHEDYKKLRGLS